MKRLVLTFDDGPDPIYTQKILDVLKDNKIKATFFVVAQNADSYPSLITRMKAEGHGVALHSLAHRHALLSSYRYMKYDFSKSMELLQKQDCDIRFYRPPWGARNLFTRFFVNKYNLQMVLWDIMIGDWKAGKDPERMAEQLHKRAFDGAIICLHDGCEKYGGAKGAPFNTIDALKLAIPKLKEEGYNFVTVEDFFTHA